MAAPPKVMLHPALANRLRTVAERIDANVAGHMGWRRMIEALRASGDIRPDEDVEAFVINDDGIQIYYREKR